MFHSNTEQLIGYWRRLRRDGAVPARAAVDPSGFVALASRTFVAARAADGEFEFRLAGEMVIDLLGRPLRGAGLAVGWRAVHRRRIAGLLEAALTAGEPLVIAAEAWTRDASHLRLEVLFLPLSGPHGAADRFLGLYQPVAGKWRGPIGELALVGAHGVADDMLRAHLRLAAVDGRQIA
jgi:hypothetical protein